MVNEKETPKNFNRRRYGLLPVVRGDLSESNVDSE